MLTISYQNTQVQQAFSLSYKTITSDRSTRERGKNIKYMAKQIKTIEIKPNQKREGKAFGCSEIFTLDNKGKVIKKEWKCEEIKDWKW